MLLEFQRKLNLQVYENTTRKLQSKALLFNYPFQSKLNEQPWRGVNILIMEVQGTVLKNSHISLFLPAAASNLNKKNSLSVLFSTGRESKQR